MWYLLALKFGTHTSGAEAYSLLSISSCKAAHMTWWWEPQPAADAQHNKNPAPFGGAIRGFALRFSDHKVNVVGLHDKKYQWTRSTSSSGPFST